MNEPKVKGVLCLTRATGEAVMINGVGSITVLSIGNGKVRLGFDIDRTIGVYREELAERPGFDVARAPIPAKAPEQEAMEK